MTVNDIGSGVVFTSENKKLEAAFGAAVALIAGSVRLSPAGIPMLIEGDDYQGCWLESTGTASAEVLSRFFPSLAESTFLSFALLARDDGLLPYKITGAGAAFRQIQTVTPLARSVWTHWALNGKDAGFLARMYGAMSANDAWLARNRDTRGTGCVEAFCAFDTGHDLSPRFWHIPDTCHLENPALYDPDVPVLPFLAPDLTANAFCQRKYLARIARELGLEAEAAQWETRAESSRRSLMRECYDAADGCFYDRDALGRFVRVQGDALLRVFCCCAGDDDLFASALSRYLLEPKKFFAKFPPTSIAMDDPRFDPSSLRNSWAGPTNMLSLLRSPAAFEHHRRFVELTWYMKPTLEALEAAGVFPQCLDPWTGAAGYGTGYTPASLCLLDFVERSMGILPLEDGSLRFSANGAHPSSYSRKTGAGLFRLESDRNEGRIFIDERLAIVFPAGLLVFADGGGRVAKIANAVPRTVSGSLVIDGSQHHFSILPNQLLGFDRGEFTVLTEGGFIAPP